MSRRPDPMDVSVPAPRMGPAGLEAVRRIAQRAQSPSDIVEILFDDGPPRAARFHCRSCEVFLVGRANGWDCAECLYRLPFEEAKRMVAQHLILLRELVPEVEAPRSTAPRVSLAPRVRSTLWQRFLAWIS